MRAEVGAHQGKGLREREREMERMQDDVRSIGRGCGQPWKRCKGAVGHDMILYTAKDHTAEENAGGE